MGKRGSKLAAASRASAVAAPPNEVSFDDFEVLRAIGRGAFGKVCLVEHKDSKRVLAMKYVNKQACLKRGAVDNVCAEVEILRLLDHPFAATLWYTFQDAEDLFIILEPLLGGDLRYYLSCERSVFSEEETRFICAEIGCALDYLRSRWAIIHRDVKPDNILLDEAGHARLTDFNVATRLSAQDKYATSMAGTKPYMAPEIFLASLPALAEASSSTSHLAAVAMVFGRRGKSSPGHSSPCGSSAEATSARSGQTQGYSYAVDWWSLGVVAFELVTGRRPFDIHSDTTAEDCVEMMLNADTSELLPSSWSPEFLRFVQGLLCTKPERRICSVAQMKKQRLMANVNFCSLEKKRVPPPFVPSAEGLNCDPTYELEEMIVETKPLHKKKKRLLRQQTLLTQKLLEQSARSQPDQAADDDFSAFPVFSRDWERYQQSLNEKESLWEDELRRLMDKSAGTANTSAAQK